MSKVPARKARALIRFLSYSGAGEYSYSTMAFRRNCCFNVAARVFLPDMQSEIFHYGAQRVLRRLPALWPAGQPRAAVPTWLLLTRVFLAVYAMRLARSGLAGGLGPVARPACEELLRL